MTENLRIALECRVKGLNYPETGRVLSRAQATVFEYFIKMRKNILQFTDRHSASYYHLFQITIGILKLKPEDFFLLENFFESVAQSNLTTPYKKA